MDRRAVLAAYDEQIRRGGKYAERDEHVVRTASPDGWAGVTWSDLAGADVAAVIDAQLDRFAGLGRPWEWKHYSHDEPVDLPGLLTAAGFTPEPPETLLAAEIAELDRTVSLPPGARLEPVTDEAGIAALVAVHDEVFGGDHSRIGRAIAAEPDTIRAVLAVVDGRPVAAARVEFVPGTGFAGLWGGGTLPGWRGRGLFRALVAHRAALAAARGYRYLHVDAGAQSRPILRRLGFTELAVTTPFISPYPPARPDSRPR